MENYDPNLIGSYGTWAAQLHLNHIPSLSFRQKKWKKKDLETCHAAGKMKVLECLAVPDMGKLPKVQVLKSENYEGLQIDEVSWQLPHGRPTRARILKPADATGKLPGILAFHDHSGNKYFGLRKITHTNEPTHPHMVALQKLEYGGRAWANEIAKKGYVVLVPDAFTFGSRRVMLADVSEEIRRDLEDAEFHEHDKIEAYNSWAGNHEHILAKSLFCAGTTWPGVFFAEDRVALDILAAREDVDPTRLGCGGLSGGGLRTVLMAGLDERIKCSVGVGFMTTWKDLLLNKSWTHTWMTYIPGLPPHLDFPEILTLRAPQASLVLNNSEDSLFTLPEMKVSDQIMKEVYEKAGASEAYRTSFYPGGHKFDIPMQKEAFDWFDQWLK